MRGLDDLRRLLNVLDGRSYGGYKKIRGTWEFSEGALYIDHVQGDPFATPSRVRVRIAAHAHSIPDDMRGTSLRRMALCDFLLRVFSQATRGGDRSGSGKSGLVLVDDGDAEILVRAGCSFVEQDLELRFRVGLPARGRRVLGRSAAQLLCEALPRAAKTVWWDNLDRERARRFIEVAEDHAALGQALAERGLVAFVPNGAVLPRRSGVSSQPMDGAVPFEAPASLTVELDTPHAGTLRGLGVPTGVTLITGGGYHGKTTLLDAIQNGIYPHVPGDGREHVATVDTAVKVRSEDGRSVAGVDLSGFIHDLPGDKSTTSFSTPDASGSTSLAAAIVEALEVGATALLLDEDTSATNLLIRDARMQQLVARETITPLIDRVVELHESHGVSTVLVVGGSGDYLEVADTVILMENYLPLDATSRAQEVARAHPTGRAVARADGPLTVAARRPIVASLDPSRQRKSKVRAHGLRELRYGDDAIDLSSLEQLVDDSQARAIGVLLTWLGRHGNDGHTLDAMLKDVLAVAEREGLYAIESLPELAAVRRFELAAAMNRLRSLRVSGERC